MRFSKNTRAFSSDKIEMIAEAEDSRIATAAIGIIFFHNLVRGVIHNLITGLGIMFPHRPFFVLVPISPHLCLYVVSHVVHEKLDVIA